MKAINKQLVEYNERQQAFDYNYLEEDGSWHKPPFSFSWQPICIVPKDIAYSREFLDLAESLSHKDYPFERVANEILTYLMKQN